eukprot:m.235012 g.235012  ORF g.235012 m.235012 type:complete len:208 (-) comp19857_c0_seq1:300-923(-)
MQSHSEAPRYAALPALPQFQTLQHSPIEQWSRNKAANTAAARTKLAESRAGYTYAEMIRSAITSSKSGQMYLFQIYEYLQTHFGCFRNATDQNWKNSVRHSLSINPLFKRVDPPGATLPGVKRKVTAGLWTMRAGIETQPRTTPLKRKFEEAEQEGSPTATAFASSPVPASPAPTPSPTCSMADRDVAEMLMALASGSYGSASPPMH